MAVETPPEMPPPHTHITMSNLTILTPSQTKINLETLSYFDDLSAIVHAVLSHRLDMSDWTNYNFHLVTGEDSSSADHLAKTPMNIFVPLGDAVKKVAGEDAKLDNLTIQIVPKLYDLGSIQDHIQHCRATLSGGMVWNDVFTQPKTTEADPSSPADSTDNAEDWEKVETEESNELTQEEINAKAKKDFTERREQNMEASIIRLKEVFKSPSCSALMERETSHSLTPSNLLDGCLGAGEFFGPLTGAEEGTSITAQVADTTTKKNKKNKGKSVSTSVPTSDTVPSPVTAGSVLLKKISIIPSGFNPPPSSRILAGDLYYLDVVIPPLTPSQTHTTLHVTCSTKGFYLNKCSNGTSGGNKVFNPTKKSLTTPTHPSILSLLKTTVANFEEVFDSVCADLKLSRETTYNKLKESEATAGKNQANKAFKACVNPLSNANESISSFLVSPNWIVDNSKSTKHEYDLNRATKSSANTIPREWNDEIFRYKYAEANSIEETLEKAVQLNKTLSDFGQEAVNGVVGIRDGRIKPMADGGAHGEESYLYNNLFFLKCSTTANPTADDVVTTFGVHEGHVAYRKAVNHEVNVSRMLTKINTPNFSTFATCCVEFFGERYLVQTVAPGIITAPTLGTANAKSIVFHGCVQTGEEFIANDEKAEANLQEVLSKNFQLATRDILRIPMSTSTSKPDDPSAVSVTGAVEVKGVNSTDGRQYFLEIQRVTPRDANFVSESEGGTKMIEGVGGPDVSMALLRKELLDRFGNKHLMEYLEKNEEVKKDLLKHLAGKDDEASKKEGQKILIEHAKTERTDIENINSSLIYNINVLYPKLNTHVKSDREAAELWESDTKLVTDAAKFLFDVVIPQFHNSIFGRMPVDGDHLTNLLHEYGINMRYLGVLASKAAETEKIYFGQLVERNIPSHYRNLLECEIVARASKHVLDKYMRNSSRCASHNGVGGMVVTFLNALMCAREETAREEEVRLTKSKKDDDTDGGVESPSWLTLGLSLNKPEGSGKLSYSEIWDDIIAEATKRFPGYKLEFWGEKVNNKVDNKLRPRALYLQLLRRVCQRSGLQLKAKDYAFVKRDSECKFAYSSASDYPICPDDLVDILPMLKHGSGSSSAMSSSSFVPVKPTTNDCSSGSIINTYDGPHQTDTNMNLHLFCEEANLSYESACRHFMKGAMGEAFNLCNRALQLYSHIVVGECHEAVAKCCETLAILCSRMGETGLSVNYAQKALEIFTRVYGVDSRQVISCHTLLADLYRAVQAFDLEISHLKMHQKLLEFVGGNNHPTVFKTCYHLGEAYLTISSRVSDKFTAVAEHFFEKSYNIDNGDLGEKILAMKKIAFVKSRRGDNDGALQYETEAHNILKLWKTEDHEETVASKEAIKKYLGRRIAAVEKQKELSEKELLASDGNKGEGGGVSKKKKKKKKGGK